MLVQTIIYHYYTKDGRSKAWECEARFKEDLADAFDYEVGTEDDFDELDYIEECGDWHEDEEGEE